MSTGTYVDINGLLKIQNDYLQNSPILNGSVSTGTHPQIDNLKTQITNLQSSVANSSEPILTHQNDISNILNKETIRLNTKKDTIDNALTTQKRMIQMNNSDGKKNAEYIKMIVGGVFVLAIIIILIFLTRIFPFINGIAVLISVLLISGFIIFCVHKYYVISSRDKMDFDKLYVAQPNTSTPEQKAATLAANQANGNLLGSLDIGGCIGSSCCDVGTVWDISGQVCKPVYATTKVVSGFTTLNTAYKTGDMPPSNIIPYEKSEFDNYNKL